MRRRLLLVFPIVALGIAAILFGLTQGLTSHQVTFKSVSRDVVAHYLAQQSPGTGFLQLLQHPTLYVVDEQDFAPQINGINTLVDGDVVSLVYENDSPTSIDVQSKFGTHLVGHAYHVAQITLYTNQQFMTFTTADYAQHPHGYYYNVWPLALVFIFVGFLALTSTPFIARRKPRPAPQPTMSSEPLQELPLPASAEATVELAPDPAPLQGTGQFKRLTLPIAAQPSQEQPALSSPSEVPTTPAPSSTTSQFARLTLPIAPQHTQEQSAISFPSELPTTPTPSSTTSQFARLTLPATPQPTQEQPAISFPSELPPTPEPSSTTSQFSRLNLPAVNKKDQP